MSATPTAQLINPFVIESLNLPTTPIAVDELAPHSDDTVNVAMADAEPNVEPSPTVATVLSEPPALTSTDLSGDSEVWDPRFYRGSYRFDPEINRLTPIVNEDLKPASSGEEDSVSSVGAATSELPGPDQDGTFPRRGLAMYYNPGIMDQVLDFRLMAGHVENCPECIGYAALLTRVDLNQRVWIEWENGDIEGPFLVIDAAAIQHVDMLNRRGWVIDVDYDTAMRRGMNRPLAVTVWTAHPE